MLDFAAVDRVIVIAVGVFFCLVGGRLRGERRVLCGIPVL